MLKKLLVYYYFLISSYFFLIYETNNFRSVLQESTNLFEFNLIIKLFGSFVFCALLFYLPILIELIFSIFEKTAEKKLIKMFFNFLSCVLLQISFVFYFLVNSFIGAYS